MIYSPTTLLTKLFRLSTIDAICEYFFPPSPHPVFIYRFTNQIGNMLRKLSELTSHCEQCFQFGISLFKVGETLVSSTLDVPLSQRQPL